MVKYRPLESRSKNCAAATKARLAGQAPRAAAGSEAAGGSAGPAATFGPACAVAAVTARFGRVRPSAGWARERYSRVHAATAADAWNDTRACAHANAIQAILGAGRRLKRQFAKTKDTKGQHRCWPFSLLEALQNKSPRSRQQADPSPVRIFRRCRSQRVEGQTPLKMLPHARIT